MKDIKKVTLNKDDLIKKISMTEHKGAYKTFYTITRHTGTDGKYFSMDTQHLRTLKATKIEFRYAVKELKKDGWKVLIK